MTVVPANIVLCRSNPLADAYLQRALTLCLDVFRGSKTFKNASVILTGSLARGEGSVIQEGEKHYSLSDMEFLVSLENSQPCSCLASELQTLEEDANKAILAAGIHCKAEFTYALRRYYINARPSIFSYELKTHGKVVLGNEDLLALISSYSIDDIPRIDAFYLLCNRMIEQLKILPALFHSKNQNPEPGFRYAILKAYVDLATSVLIFNKQYVPTYKGRMELFCDPGFASVTTIPAFEKLQERVAYWTKIKLNPSVVSFEYSSEDSPLKEWLELAFLFSQIWQWELEQLTEGNIDDLESSKGKFIRLGNPKQILMGIIKFIITALRRKELSISMGAYLAGNPRHVLYYKAATLYIDFSNNAKNWNQCVSGISELSGQIQNIVRIWNAYFRNT